MQVVRFWLVHQGYDPCELRDISRGVTYSVEHSLNRNYIGHYPRIS
jgi:hypothetical protein